MDEEGGRESQLVQSKACPIAWREHQRKHNLCSIVIQARESNTSSIKLGLVKCKEHPEVNVKLVYAWSVVFINFKDSLTH